MTKIERAEELKRVRQKIADGKTTFYLEDIRIMDFEIRRLERKVKWEQEVNRVRKAPWSIIKSRREIEDE